MTNDQSGAHSDASPGELLGAVRVFRRRILVFLFTAGLIGLLGGLAALRAAGSDVELVNYRTGIQLGHADSAPAHTPAAPVRHFSGDLARTRLRDDLVVRGRERAEAEGGDAVPVTVPSDGEDAFLVLESSQPDEREAAVRRTHDAIATLLVEAHAPRYEGWVAAQRAAGEDARATMAEPTRVLYLASPSAQATVGDDPRLILAITVLLAGLGGLFTVFLVDFLARVRRD